jgi:hypothetical protein
MLPSRLFLRRSSVVLAASVALSLASCGGEGDAFGKRYPVSGTVTYNGQPLEKGAISFVPETGAGATGIIEKGSYALSTGGEQDGAMPGKYKVTITAREDSEALAKAEFAKVSKRPESEITAIPRQFLANAAGSAKSLIPAGYGDVRSTSLTAEVKAETNTFPFTISDADAPPEPPKSGAARGKGRR